MKIEPLFNKRHNYSRCYINGVEDTTKTTRSKLCAVTEDMYKVDVDIKGAWEWMSNGKLIQDALPDLAPEQREFLISGLTPAEFEELHKEEE